MLDLASIRKEIYTKLKDDPTGEGAYSLEDMNTLIKEAFIQMCITTESIIFRSFIEKSKYCFGVYSIHDKPFRCTVRKDGNYIHTSHPAYIQWVYAECELFSCVGVEDSIKHSEGMGQQHKNAIIFYVLSIIYMHENNNGLTAFYKNAYAKAFQQLYYSKINSYRET